MERQDGAAELRARAERLVQDVERAFGGVEPPARAELLEPQEREIDAAAAEELVSELLGRRWEDLDRPWVKRNRYAFCYLSPQAWARYVPALLRDALRRLADRRSMPQDSEGQVELDYDVVAVVHELGPRYAWLVWEEGRDAQLEARIAALTPEQYDVACRFLALVHDVSPSYGATYAARWSWRLRAAPALEPVREHDRREQERLRHHEWPEHPDPRVRALVARIEAAFADRPYPGDEELLGEDGGDEPYEAALAFRGRDWRTLHPDVLYHEALSFLGDAGLCYFLPAFLIAGLHRGESAVSAVDVLSGTAADDCWAERLGDLRARECAAVAAWIRHHLEVHQGDGVLADEEAERLRASLEQHWSPRAAE